MVAIVLDFFVPMVVEDVTELEGTIDVLSVVIRYDLAVASVAVLLVVDVNEVVEVVDLIVAAVVR